MARSIRYRFYPSSSSSVAELQAPIVLDFVPPHLFDCHTRIDEAKVRHRPFDTIQVETFSIGTDFDRFLAALMEAQPEFKDRRLVLTSSMKGQSNYLIKASHAALL